MVSIKKSIVLLFALMAITGIALAEQEATNLNENKQTEQIEKKGIQIEQITDNVTNSVKVIINNQEVVSFSSSAGGFTPKQRADIFSNRVTTYIEEGGCPKQIFPGVLKGIFVGKAGDKILFTADSKTAKELKLKPEELAFKWVNNIRTALGTTEVAKNYSLIAQNSTFKSSFEKYIGKKEKGVASWYGGYFHGRTAADGSIFNTYEYTAAHKTLPFGSLVKVTNKRTKKSCVVKITDRGPFVKGRIIDLSLVAAKKIGMHGSGIAPVEVEVIGKI